MECINFYWIVKNNSNDTVLEILWNNMQLMFYNGVYCMMTSNFSWSIVLDLSDVFKIYSWYISLNLEDIF